jgi:hypothetical protein
LFLIAFVLIAGDQNERDQEQRQTLRLCGISSHGYLSPDFKLDSLDARLLPVC